MVIPEESIVDAIKATKAYISNVSNVCKSCENRDQVYFWVKATDNDIRSIKEEIDRAYNLALERCTGKTDIPYEDRWNVHSIIRAFEKTHSKEQWRIYASSPYGPGLIENNNEGVVYVIDGWDSTRPISLGKVNDKCAILTFKGKKVDRRILLARHFSIRVTKAMDKGELILKNTVLIDLGFYGDKRGEVTVYGDPGERYPLVHELVVFIENFYRNPQKFTQLIERPERRRIDAYLVKEVLRLFESNFRILDCGHLKVMERRLPFEIKRRRIPFEEQLKDAGLLYTRSSERAELVDLKNTRQKLIEKIDQLYQSEFVTTAIKKDIDGNLYKNEIRLLCKACEESYLNKYEFPGAPCGGRTCIFKHLVTKLAEQLKYDTMYVEPYELGLLFKENDALIVSRTDSVMHPADNIMLFNPSMLIVLSNFLSEETVEATAEQSYLYLPRTARSHLSGLDPTAIAYKYAKSYLLPTIAYDWASDNHGYVSIETKPPAMREIIKTIVSMEYTVGATERAYKAPHDRIVTLCEEMGLEFGFNPVKEYSLETSRIDMVWLDREKGEPKIGIEVELSGQITADLWKLCELQPSLGVLIVKGSYYNTAVDYVARSSIIRKFDQKILIFDVTEKNYTLIKGGKLVDLSNLKMKTTRTN